MGADAPEGASQREWLAGGGEMGALIRSMDWSQTPLGDVDGWPQSLRTTVSLCLSSTFPILIAWGLARVQLYNDAYRPICGEKHPAAMGQRFNECWASALPVVGGILDRAQAGTGSYLENLRMFLDRNGYLEEAFMTFSFSPVRDESGGVGGLFHPITETTDRMLGARRTQGLREIAAELGHAQSMAHVGERLVAAHAAYALDVPFFGLYEIDAVSRRARLLGAAGLPPDSPACPAELDLDDLDAAWPLARAFDEPRLYRLDDAASRLGVIACGPYPEVPSVAMLIPVIAPGEATPVAVLVAGVSARRALDAAYLAFYEQLGATVTTAVANVRAYEYEQTRAAALAELDRAKTTFFTNVSHEFRTPLTLMLGPVDALLAAGDLDAAARAELERVQRNGRRLLKLVNTLLDFSRIESGRVEASFEPVDLAPFTVDLASTFRSLMEKAGLSLDLDCAHLAELVWVDREMYEKVLLNLLSNAFKFTPSGGVRVTLRAVDGAVELDVTDTGTGVPAKELPRLFERFRRVRGARGRSYEGSGIGLALVQELVKVHGGSVRASSVVGVGTTVTVSLPLGTAHLPVDRLGASRTLTSTSLTADAFVTEAAHWTARASWEPPPPLATPPAPLARVGGTVLLVDDNADMRDYVQRLLDGRFRVETADDGEEALAAARARVPDLVLSDVMMPRLDGFGLLRELRADPRTAHVPVILLSARAGEGATVEGLAAGANDYLVKPFSAQELIARVEGNVRTAQARQDLDAFAGRIAHDLRNLLAPLPMMAAQAKAGDERMRKTGERLERLTRRAHNLLEGMLAFSRAGHAVLPGEASPVSVVVADVVDDLASQRRQADAALDLNDVDDVCVAVPRGLLYVVLLNLVQNALKFVQGRPERRVTVSARLVGDRCELRVADTGPGIAPEALTHVFEPFYRAPGATASGHGIGLATVHRIAQAAGGEVRVASVPGQGATFTVLLPSAEVFRESNV